MLTFHHSILDFGGKQCFMFFKLSFFDCQFSLIIIGFKSKYWHRHIEKQVQFSHMSPAQVMQCAEMNVFGEFYFIKKHDHVFSFQIQAESLFTVFSR